MADHASAGVAWTLLAIGLFGSARRAGGFTIAAGIFAALGALGALLGFLRMPELGMVLAFLQPAAWVFLGIWCFTALGALGGGLGIPSGIMATLGGLGLAGAYAMLLGGIARGTNSDAFIGVFMVSLGLLAVSAILVGLAFLIKVRTAPARG